MTSGASATNSAADFAGVVGIARGPAGINAHVSAVGPAQLLQPLYERREAGLCYRVIRDRIYEHADPPQAVGLLRSRRERPSFGIP